MDIPEFAKIKEESIIESLSIGSLVRFNDPVQVFKAIRHGLIKLDEFPVTSLPLVNYLNRIYKNATVKEKLRLDPSETFVYDLSEYLIERGHFDLVIKFQMEKP